MKKFIPNKTFLFGVLSLLAASTFVLAEDEGSNSQNLTLPPTGSLSAIVEQSSYPPAQSDAPRELTLNNTKSVNLGQFSGNNSVVSQAKLVGPSPALVAGGSIICGTTNSFTLNNTYNEIRATFTVAVGTKFTGWLKHMSTSNSDVDIRLYRAPVGSSTYSFVSQSAWSGAVAEQLSEISQPGTYMLDVIAIGSVVGGSVQYGCFTSTGADSNEPDDNFWQAKSRSATFGVSGNLDNSIDKDFSVFTLTSAENINYRIVGGNYQATLYSSTSFAPLFVLPNNTIGRLSVPAGTYYWAINSPTSSFSSSVPYKFSAYHNVNNVTFNFVSDEGIAGRVNWGAGLNFAFKNTATISGYAYDSNNIPARGAALKFTLAGSVGTSTVATATTDSTGYYSTTISSPSGAGANMFNGACNFYYYDVHTLKIQSDYGSGVTPENVISIKLIEGSTQTTIMGTDVLLNDVAYYVYHGC